MFDKTRYAYVEGLVDERTRLFSTYKSTTLALLYFSDDDFDTIFSKFFPRIERGRGA